MALSEIGEWIRTHLAFGKTPFREPEASWRLHFEENGDGITIAYGQYGQVYGKIIPITVGQSGYARYKKEPEGHITHKWFEDVREVPGFLEDNARVPFTHQDLTCHEHPGLILHNQR